MSSFYNEECTLASSVESIPAISDIILTPLNKKLKKSPAPGYDVKTFKKEVAFLENELNDVRQNVSLLKNQNTELWSYMTTMVNNNKNNSQIFRLQIQELHEELKNVHDEILLLQKYDNHGIYHEYNLNHNEHNKIFNDEVLDYHKIDEVLKRADSVAMMPMISDEVTNLAFTKLRNIIRYNLLLTNIDQIVGKFYRKRMLSLILNGWKNHLHHKVIGLKLQKKINNKLQYRILYHWLKMARIRKHSYVKSLKRGLNVWMKYTRWKSWSSYKANIYRNKRYMGQFFQLWKYQSTFLDWGNLIIASHYERAGHYFMRRIFNSFKNSTKQCKVEENLKIWKVTLHTKSKCYKTWLSSCQKKWQKRGQLIQSFFTKVYNLVSIKHINENSKNEAIRFWIVFNKRHVFNKWMKLLKYKSFLKSQLQLKKIIKWRFCSIFKQLLNNICTLKKVKICYNNAVIKNKISTKRHIFNRMREFSKIIRRIQWKCNAFLLMKFIKGLRKLVSSINITKKINNKVDYHQKKRKKLSMINVLHILYKRKERSKYYSKYQNIIKWKHNRYLLETHFKVMSSTWSINLYKKLIVKKSKKVSECIIRDSRNTQKELLQREGEAKISKIHEHEDKIIELQKIISENVILLNSTDSMIQEEEYCLRNISKELEETQQMTLRVIQEHGKYRNVDHMMAIRKQYEDLKKNTVDETIAVHKDFGKDYLHLYTYILILY